VRDSQNLARVLRDRPRPPRQTCWHGSWHGRDATLTPFRTVTHISTILAEVYPAILGRRFASPPGRVMGGEYRPVVLVADQPSHLRPTRLRGTHRPAVA